jgi:AcrR family transcriptional regulator
MEATAKADPTPKARGRRGTRVSGDDRERAILETAEQLLEEKPLSEISVDDLAKGAGISRSTFYFYFPSRDAVVLTIIERMIPAITAASRPEAMAQLPENPRAGLTQLLEEIYDAFLERKAVVLAAAALRTSNTEAQELWEAIMDRWISDAAAIIEVERARAVAPQGLPARDLATALVQMNERVQFATFVSEKPSLDRDKAIEVCVEIWMRAIYGTVDPE